MSHFCRMIGLGEKMRFAVEASGLTLVEVAGKLGVSVRTLHNYFNDEREPNLDRLLDFSDLTGAPIEQLIVRDAGHVVDLASEEGSSDFVLVDYYDVELSAGQGRVRNETGSIGQFAFRSDWLKRVGLLATHATLVRVAGESMEPTLADGSIVLIDHRDKTAVSKAHIFAVREGEMLSVKRVERDAQNKVILLHSDNPTAPTRVIEAKNVGDFEIIGRVVWSARTWPN